MGNVLVRVGGEVYVHDECCAFATHYMHQDVGFPTVDIEPEEPLLPFLHELVEEIRLNPDGPPERINLLYRPGRKVDLTKLEGEIDRFTGLTSEDFDFFVHGYHEDYSDVVTDEEDYAVPLKDCIRFARRNQLIYRNGARVAKRTKTGDVFPRANELRAIYLASPRAKIPPNLLDLNGKYVEETILEDCGAQVEAENQRDLLTRLEKKVYGVRDHEVTGVGNDLIALRVLWHMAFYPDVWVSVKELVEDSLMEDGYGCPCEFEGPRPVHTEEEVRALLQDFVETGFLEADGDGHFIATGERIRKPEDPNQQTLFKVEAKG